VFFSSSERAVLETVSPVEFPFHVKPRSAIL